MGINARPGLHPRMTQAGASVVSHFEACVIQVFNPRTGTGNDNFDVWTNETGSDPILIWGGAAQMQVFRQTLTVEVPAGGMTQIRSARFTISDLTLPPVPKGFVVRVTGVDSSLNQDAKNYQFVVTGGLQAPLGFSTTLECEVDMGVLL